MTNTFPSNGSSNVVDPTCSFCHTPPANGDPMSITVVRFSNLSDRIAIHIFCGIGGIGLKITQDQKKYFDRISSGKKLEPLYLNDKDFNSFNGYIKSLQKVGSHQHEDRKRIHRSKKIFESIINFNDNRISEEEIKALLSKTSDKKSEEYTSQNESSFSIAAAM